MLTLRQKKAGACQSRELTYTWSDAAWAPLFRIALAVQGPEYAAEPSQNLPEVSGRPMVMIDLPGQDWPPPCGPTMAAQPGDFEASLKLQLRLNHSEKTLKLSVQKDEGNFDFQIHCNPQHGPLQGDNDWQIMLQPQTRYEHESRARLGESKSKYSAPAVLSDRIVSTDAGSFANFQGHASQAEGWSALEAVTLKNNNALSYQPPAPQPQSLKRNRSENDSSSSYSSSDSDESSNSDFVSDTDSDVEWDKDEAGKHFFQSLAFQNLRGKLQPLVYDEICTGIAPARCITPPDDILPLRTVAKRQRRIRSESKRSESASGFIMVPRINNYLHLACPFYKFDPINYRDCFKDHDVQSIEDIIRHLRRHHKLPPYCPICRRTFKSAMERDSHTRQRECQMRNTGYVEIQGLSESQLKKIARRDMYNLCERRRWMRIWKTTFPESEAPRSPYLDAPVEQRVTLARDYWSVYGKDLVGQILQDDSIVGTEEVPIDDEMLEILSNLVLEDAITKILDRGPNNEHSRGVGCKD